MDTFQAVGLSTTVYHGVPIADFSPDALLSNTDSKGGTQPIHVPTCARWALIRLGMII